MEFQLESFQDYLSKYEMLPELFEGIISENKKELKINRINSCLPINLKLIKSLSLNDNSSIKIFRGFQDGELFRTHFFCKDGEVLKALITRNWIPHSKLNIL